MISQVSLGLGLLEVSYRCTNISFLVHVAVRMFIITYGTAWLCPYLYMHHNSFVDSWFCDGTFVDYLWHMLFFVAQLGGNFAIAVPLIMNHGNVETFSLCLWGKLHTSNHFLDPDMVGASCCSLPFYLNCRSRKFVMKRTLS